MARCGFESESEALHHCAAGGALRTAGLISIAFGAAANLGIEMSGPRYRLPRSLVLGGLLPAPRVVFAVAFFGPVIGPGVGVGSARPRETRDQSGSCWGDDEDRKRLGAVQAYHPLESTSRVVLRVSGTWTEAYPQA